MTAILSKAGQEFQKIEASVLNAISANEELLQKIKTFNNTKVRQQLHINNVNKHVSELVDYIETYYQKEVDSKKTEKGKTQATAKKQAVTKFFTAKNKKQLEHILTLMNLLVDAKLILVKKLDEVKKLNTFLLTKNGYQVTGVEGYVAIDHLTGNAVKLVDRLQFSYANFSTEIIKGWQR